MCLVCELTAHGALGTTHGAAAASTSAGSGGGCEFNTPGSPDEQTALGAAEDHTTFGIFLSGRHHFGHHFGRHSVCIILLNIFFL